MDKGEPAQLTPRLQRHEEALHNHDHGCSCAHCSCTCPTHDAWLESRHRWNARSNVGEYSRPNSRCRIGLWDLAGKYVRRKISSSQGQPKSISARVLLPCSTKLLGHVAHDAVFGNLGIRLVDSGELFGGDHDELLRHAASHQLVGMVLHY